MRDMPVRQILAIVTLCATATPALAQPALPAGLDAGPHAVGFRILTVEDPTRPTGPRLSPAERTSARARTLRVHVWYPAAAPAGATWLTVGDYIQVAGPQAQAHRQDLTRLMGITLSDADWAAYTGRELTASRDAAPASARFPLIVGMLRAVSNVVAAEHLASHGYVIAMVERQPRETLIADGLAREALILAEYVQDMRVVIARMREEPFVDSARLGAHGFSGDGLAQIVLAMRHPDVDAVALFETGWLAPTMTSSFQEMAAYDPLAMRAAVFYAYSENLGRNSLEHIAELRGMRYGPRSLLYLGEPRMTHLDFVTEGLVLAEVHERRRSLRDQINRVARAAYDYQLTFLNAYVKGDAAAATKLSTTPEVGPGALVELTHLPAIEPALARAELTALMDKDPAAALSRARADLARDPQAPAFAADWLNAAGYSYLQRGQHDRAIAFFTLMSEALPRSANAFDSLSEGLEAAGRKPEALAAAERALALLPSDRTVPPAQRASLEAGLRARIGRVK
jgi:tetratricopeptide (TPR) repeat protein